MAYKHVIRAKTKNLFDVNKITKSTNLKNNKDGTITVSIYGVSGGLLKNLCPELKVGDVIKVYFQPLRWTATKPPLVISAGGVIFDRNGNSTLTVTEESLNQPVYFYNNDYGERKLPGTTIIGNILITNDLTITNENHNELYTPYNYLQSNKRMIKVSDVCQLLPISDKEDGVAAGVTFTNNHNGTWTASGISTNSFSYYNIFSMKLIEGHMYLAPSENSENNTYVEYKFLDNGVPQWGITIYTAKDKSTIDIGLIRLKAATADPTTCDLQLFDLTEMYGAGHEPATVAEFRQRFPNELYPYSPQCWLTSYKSAVVCKTKNLFDVNNAVPYDFSTDNYDSNLVWLNDGIYTTRMNNYNMGSGLRIKNGLSLPAGKYTLSVRLVDFYNADRFVLGMRCKNTEGKWVVWSWGYTASEHKSGDILAFANTLPENTDLRLYLCYQNENGQYLTGYVSYKDIQLEQGPTETSYVPYQHL